MEHLWRHLKRRLAGYKNEPAEMQNVRQRPVECKLTKGGQEYAGLKNEDANGFKCQPWLSKASNKKSSLQEWMNFPDQTIDSSHNFCRNPTGELGGPWCYNDEGSDRRGHCEVPFCFEVYLRSAIDGQAAKGYPECLLTLMGREYAGTERKTETGKTCLQWDKQPHGITKDFKKEMFYEDHFRFGNSSLHENFCRNPTLKERPWCFVEPPDFWEFCDIPLCPNFTNRTECKWTKEGEEYAGSRNVTATGRPCLHWEESAKMHWMSFPKGMRRENHNFCRNMEGDSGGPHCIVKTVDDPFLDIEYSDVPFCPFHYLQ
ncbi:unnamed protein product [Darwinula stevensoni]|uniref:Kringle domain-containing protein n=1 Tax=Darwinula stevensoni TaxID=69355 RepID=A0A7R9FSD5_9CRUS|nr:unnamed protein product [Darwinula stevensoni]CAG0903019.1 unnamed protein product [Darwinula stevensoni]